MIPLRTLLVIGFNFIAAACAQLPDRPIVDTCAIDWPRQQATCARPTQAQANAAQGVSPKELNRIYNTLPGEERWREPLSNFDKAWVDKPATREAIDVYIQKLRRYAEQECRGDGKAVPVFEN